MAFAQVWAQAEKKRKDAPLADASKKPGAKKEKRSAFSEAEVQEILGEVCHRRKKGGEWIWRTDLVEVSPEVKPDGVMFHRGLTKAERATDNHYLLVAETYEPGKWDHEKATLKRACDEIFETMDLDEISSAVWRRSVKDANALIKLACKELSSSCHGATRMPLLKGAVRADAVFTPSDSKLVETEQMMQNMEEAGQPMVMQSREDLEEEMREMADSMGMTQEELEGLMKTEGGGGGGGGGEL
jgi:hypothetical protein